ncbi:Mapk3 [Symbiodinium sp. CCMP2592]|nr:Mapk3 [Symbiodinium sp. CCMP2592]
MVFLAAAASQAPSLATWIVWGTGGLAATVPFCFKHVLGQAEEPPLRAIRDHARSSSKQYCFEELFPTAEVLPALLRSGRHTVHADLPHLRFVKVLGSGTYGMVSKYHSLSGEDVAVKTMQNFASNRVAARRCLREINILKSLHHSNIVFLKEVVALKEPATVHLVMELMDATLFNVIYSGEELREEYVQFWIYGILLALQYMHGSDVVHRDLKPQNILVNKNCDVKLCDFGLARGPWPDHEGSKEEVRTDYVGTRWYRAPEVLLEAFTHTSSVDIWSLGCVLAELTGRRVLFPGNSSVDQLKQILRVVGTPRREDCFAQRVSDLFQQPGFVFEKQPWGKLFPLATEQNRSLLDALLQFNPQRRIAARDALHHGFVSEYFDEADVVQPPTICWDFDRPGALKELLARIVSSSTQQRG